MTQPTGTHDQPKIQLTVQPPQPVAKVQDTSPERIMAYRHQIGFTGEAPYVYAYYQKLTALTPLSQKYFLISLEANGLLILGLNIHVHFNGQNKFISFAEMTKVKVNNHGLTYFINIKTTSDKLKATVVKGFLHQSWQRTNAKLIAEQLPKKINTTAKPSYK